MGAPEKKFTIIEDTRRHRYFDASGAVDLTTVVLQYLDGAG